MKALNFFVAQPITFATNLPGSAKTRLVSTRIMCVTAIMTGDGSDERNCGKLVIMTVVLVVVVIVAACL